MKEPRIEEWMFGSAHANDTKRRAKIRKIARRLQRRGGMLKGGAMKRWAWLSSELV